MTSVGLCCVARKVTHFHYITSPFLNDTVFFKEKKTMTLMFHFEEF